MSQHIDEKSDESLLADYRRGDEEAFSLLFRRYSRRIHGYVLGFVRDPDSADEVTQKVFVKLSRVPEKFRPTGSFASWIHRVARNAALDAIKGRRDTVPLEELARQEERTGEVPAPARPTSPDGGAAGSALRELVASAIGRLEGIQREALILREYSELSYREISKITGRSLTNVKQDIYQARQSLREELAPVLGRTMEP